MSISTIKEFLLEEKHIHEFFVFTLWVKCVDAVIEIIGGVAAFFVTKQFLVDTVQWVFQREFVEDPHDLVANFFLHSVQGLSIGAQDFAAIYLLAHGVIKLWLIIGLLREKLWYYPTALGVFALFIAYQLYRYTFTHSLWLMLITILDVIVILLTWHEWRYMRRQVSKILPATE